MNLCCQVQRLDSPDMKASFVRKAARQSTATADGPTWGAELSTRLNASSPKPGAGHISLTSAFIQ